MRLDGLEQALRENCRIHGFRSGGGLRVVRIEQDGTLRGYGEHPHVEDALAHANEDFLAGGRPYKEVYGVLKPHYFTGESTPTSDLDAWLLQGRTFDAYFESDAVVVELKGLHQVTVPEEIQKAVLEDGQTRFWEDRGIKYKISWSRFPGSKKPCCTTEVVEPAEGKDEWFYNIVKLGEGSTFFEALNAAYEAEEVELVGA